MPTAADLKMVARLLAWSAIAGLVPERRWQAVLRACSPRLGEVRKKRILRDSRESALKIEHALGAETDPEDVLFEHQADTLCILKDRWSGGWKPRLEVRGLEHVEAAQAAGRGAVLWVALQYNRLAWKKGLHQAGLRVSHLSRPEHGFSETEFGQQRINPFCTRVEERYVDRVVLEPGAEVKALRALRQLLGANRIVSIQDSGRGAKTVTVPFLNGSRSFFTGAPTLAFSSGAALLPLFTLREEDGSWIIEIGPSIEAPPGASRTAAVTAMTGEFAAMLERHVRRSPERWDWSRWTPDAAAGN